MVKALAAPEEARRLLDQANLRVRRGKASERKASEEMPEHSPKGGGTAPATAEWVRAWAVQTVSLVPHWYEPGGDT